MSVRPRIGVFGGQFDPPHAGHVALVTAAMGQLGLDRLIVVPAARPPHREAPAADPETRLRMARAAFAGIPHVEVSRIEIDRPGPSYTADTLEALAPMGDLLLLLGADQLAALSDWHDPGRVRALAALAVAPRDDGEAAAADVTVLDMTPIDVSSSAVRAALRAGADPADLLPAPVAAVVAAAGLYRQGEC
jgi:nicotinate-nucleotide adenylyltransferase